MIDFNKGVLQLNKFEGSEKKATKEEIAGLFHLTSQ